MAETLEKEQHETIKNGTHSIDDSGIELSGEEKEKVEPNLTINCPWVLGQLAWARGSSYPFWPCVVTLDPKTMIYFRVQNKGRSQAVMIHVQYFGDGGRHNWVLSHYMMPFSGLEDFNSEAKSIAPEKKKKDPKLAAAFSPKLAVKKQWGTGVTEASGLMHLTNEERASMFEPVAPPPVQTVDTPNNKLKRKLSAKGSKIPNETPTPGPKRFKKVESEDQAGKLISNSESASKLVTESVYEPRSVPEELKNETPITSRRKSTRSQHKSIKEVAEVHKRQYIRKKISKLSEEEKNRRDELDFEDYYNLNKDFWKNDHPDASDSEVRKLLKDMWNEMDTEEKSNNLNRNFDNYRYNSTIDQPKVKRFETNLPENDSKNKENSQQGNENITKVNGKTADKTNPENEKEIEVPKTNGTPQKEKVKEILKTNGSPQKEKKFPESTTTTTTDDFQNEKGEENIPQKEKCDENSKIEVVPENGKNNDSENKSCEEDLENKNLKPNASEEEKLCQSCLKKSDSVLKARRNETKMKVNTAEKDEENDNKMEVDEAEITGNGKFVCTNCQKEKV